MTIAQEREVKESFKLFTYLKTFQTFPDMILIAYGIQKWMTSPP